MPRHGRVAGREAAGLRRRGEASLARSSSPPWTIWWRGSERTRSATTRRSPARRCRTSCCPTRVGSSSSLDEVLEKGPVAVTFHRGHWCPYCRINTRALAEAQEQIAAEGGQVAAIMPDREHFAAELKAQVLGAVPDSHRYRQWLCALVQSRLLGGGGDAEADVPGGLGRRSLAGKRYLAAADSRHLRRRIRRAW